MREHGTTSLEGGEVEEEASVKERRLFREMGTRNAERQAGVLEGESLLLLSRS